MRQANTTSEDAISTPPARGRWWRRLLGIIAGVALCALVPTLLKTSRDRAEFEARLAAIRAAGEPLTAEDFAARYPEPAPESDFRQLLRSCLPPGSPPGAEPDVAGGELWQQIWACTNRLALPPELAEKVQMAVRSNTAPVELLLRTDLTGYRFRSGWTNGWSSMLNGGVGEAVGEKVFLRIMLNRALALQSVHEAEQGQGSRAVAAFIRGLQLSRMPSSLALVGGVGRLAGASCMMGVLERVLNRTMLTDADLERLQTALSAPDPLARDTLVDERALQLYLWTHPSDPNLVFAAGGRSLLAAAANRVGGMARGYAGRLQMLDRWTRLVDATSGSAADLVEAGRRHGSEIQRLLQSPTWMSPAVARTLSLDYRLVWLLEPKIVALLTEHALLLATRANARTAVAIERWRLAHGGELPATVTDLSPRFLDAPVEDPFDGQPVRYRRLARGYVVYCVGLDGHDDGGREGNRGESPGYDTTLIIER